MLRCPASHIHWNVSNGFAAGASGRALSLPYGQILQPRRVTLQLHRQAMFRLADPSIDF